MSQETQFTVYVSTKCNKGKKKKMKGREKTIKRDLWQSCPIIKIVHKNVLLMHQNLLFSFGFVSYHYLIDHSRTTFKSDLWGFKEKIGN